MPEPLAEKVTLPFEIWNPKSSPSKFAEPIPQFKDNLKESVFSVLSATEIFKPVKETSLGPVVTVPVAILEAPSKSSIVLMDVCQLFTAFPEACDIVKAVNIVGKLSASLSPAPPSLTLNCQTWTPVLVVKGEASFINEEIVADSPLKVIISDVEDTVTLPLHVTFCVVAPPPALEMVSPLNVPADNPAFNLT